jgi:hypothetical protein
MQNSVMLRGRSAWVISIGVAVLLAGIGVWAYARHPSVRIWQLNGLLLLPLVAIVLIALHRVLPMRVQWIAAWLAAPLGGLAYLLWPNDQTWNYGMFTAIPLMGQRERMRQHRGTNYGPVDRTADRDDLAGCLDAEGQGRSAPDVPAAGPDDLVPVPHSGGLHLDQHLASLQRRRFRQLKKRHLCPVRLDAGGLRLMHGC